MQRPWKNHAYHFTMLTAVCLCGFIIVANATARSRQGARDAASTKIRKLLSDEEADDEDVVHDIFKFGDKAVPTLVRALKNRKNMERTVWALAYLGGPEQRRLLLQAAATEKNKEMKLFMAGFVAGALVEPASEEEWNFLATCIKGYKDEDEGMAAFYAALALGENGSQRALRILQMARPTQQAPDLDGDALREIRQAIHWITEGAQNRQAISAEGTSDSGRVKQVVLADAFYAEGERADLSVGEVIFTDNKGRALASVEIYHGPKEARGYDIVLERRRGAWKIVGIWFTWVA